MRAKELDQHQVPMEGGGIEGLTPAIGGSKVRDRIAHLDGLAAIKFLLDGHPKHSIAIFKAHIAFYGQISTFLKKRKHLKISQVNYNSVGQFKKSIVFRHFLGGVKNFSQLKESNFK